MPEPIDIWAHRGGGLIAAQKYNFSPNSIESFEFALSNGSVGIETDVCLTNDNEPIVYHPGTLSPCPITMKWTECHLKYPELIHLQDLFWYLIGVKLQCLLDIKVESKLLAEKMVDLIDEAELFETVYLTAPRLKIPSVGLGVSPSSLQYAKSLDSRIKIHIIDALPFNIAKTFTKFNANKVSFGWTNDSKLSGRVFDMIFYKKMLRQLIKTQLADKYTLAGIVRHEKDVRYLMTCTDGLIKGIMTDDPEITKTA